MDKNELRHVVYGHCEPGLKQVAWSALQSFSDNEITWIVDHLIQIEFGANEKAAKSVWNENGKRVIRVGWTGFHFAPKKVKLAILILEYYDLLNGGFEPRDMITPFGKFLDEVNAWRQFEAMRKNGYYPLNNAELRTSVRLETINRGCYK